MYPKATFLLERGLVVTKPFGNGLATESTRLYTEKGWRCHENSLRFGTQLAQRLRFDGSVRSINDDHCWTVRFPVVGRHFPLLASTVDTCGWTLRDHERYPSTDFLDVSGSVLLRRYPLPRDTARDVRTRVYKHVTWSYPGK